MEPLQTGKIGRYEVVGELARGGMAEILLGRLTGPSGFERPVVIKRILPAFAEERAFVDMFLDEARIAARIAHPNVVQHQELGQDEGGLYLVMEYLAGESLASVQRRARSRGRPIEPAQAAYIVAEAAAGLHAAHEMKGHDGSDLGIVHRDISPQNLFVTYDGSVKVMDFGIAKAADRITVTEAGALKGKFSYMSPEQATGSRLDRRSDVFSLGIVLYELTTGRSLFRRSTQLASLRAVSEVDMVPPSRFVEGYPPELERICLVALAADPADRYPDAEAMRRELLFALRELAPDIMPQESLRETMRALFPDRIAQKREMLHRVSVGDGLENVPSAEVDREVELPSIVVDVETPAEPVGRPRAKWWWAIPAVGALLAGGVFVVIGLGEDEVADPTPPPLAESRAPEMPPAAPASSWVTVTIESDPPGARVLIDDDEQGTTPAALRLSRADRPVAVRLEHAGYEPLETEVLPDLDQRLRLSLVRTPAPESRRRRRARRPEREPEQESPPAFPRFN